MRLGTIMKSTIDTTKQPCMEALLFGYVNNQCIFHLILPCGPCHVALWLSCGILACSQSGFTSECELVIFTKEALNPTQ